MHFAPCPPGQEVSASPGQVPGYHRQPPGAGQAASAGNFRLSDGGEVPEWDVLLVCHVPDRRWGGCSRVLSHL